MKNIGFEDFFWERGNQDSERKKTHELINRRDSVLKGKWKNNFHQFLNLFFQKVEIEKTWVTHEAR